MPSGYRLRLTVGLVDGEQQNTKFLGIGDRRVGSGS
jgi:hypothetical protein